MSSVPPGLSPLRQPHGDIVFYSTGRPCLRLLLQQIAALGYSVSASPLSHTALSSLSPGVWHCVVVISDFILFIVTPTAPSSFLDSLSYQSAYESSNNAPDSDAFHPDDSLDQSADGSSSPNGFDSDNVDPDFPELGYNHS
jgi:hypothetical protein